MQRISKEAHKESTLLEKNLLTVILIGNNKMEVMPYGLLNYIGWWNPKHILDKTMAASLDPEG